MILHVMNFLFMSKRQCKADQKEKYDLEKSTSFIPGPVSQALGDDFKHVMTAFHELLNHSNGWRCKTTFVKWQRCEFCLKTK